MALTLRRGDRLVIATHNEGKVRELDELFAPLGIECRLGRRSSDCPSRTRPATSFAENAGLKAEAAAAASGMIGARRRFRPRGRRRSTARPASIRRAGRGPAKDFGLAMQRVATRARRRAARNDRPRAISSARWRLPGTDGPRPVFEGKVYGTLVWPPRGTRGFGYDPIFVPDGYDETFGEMDPAKKNAIVAPQRAFEKLIVRPIDENAGPRLRRLCALAVLPRQMPVLRLQQPRPARRHRRGALSRRLSARARAFRFA